MTTVRLLVAAATIATVMLATPLAARAQVCGDADDSGSITVTDGVNVLRAAAALGACEPTRCDVDGNGSVTVTDGVNVLRAAAGLGNPTGCSSGGSLGPRRTFLRDLSNQGVLPRYRAPTRRRPTCRWRSRTS
jgi:hypothetical protein